MTNYPSLRALFESLVELDADARAQRLDSVGGDTARRLRAMLAGDLASEALPASAESLLDRLLDGPDRLAMMPAARWMDAAIGPFRVKRLIGEGGSSSVFLAERQLEAGVQTVALKLVHGGIWSPGARRRSLREQAVLAQLSHPHIARLIDAGVTNDGVPYIAMEYVEGEPITQYANRARLGLIERLRLVHVLCSTIDSAHAALVVHCDLKPSNVFIDCKGQMKILDFGVARLLDDTGGVRDATRTLAFTPEYAAPEQFHAGAPTVQVDVFSIGILLGELLTGERHREGSANVSSRVASPDAATLPPGMPARATLARALRGDLDAILAKATASSLSERYRSAAALGADIDRFLEGLPVAARKASLAYGVRKFIGRHRLAVVLSCMLVLTLVAAVLIARVQAETARSEAARANAMRDAVFDVFSEAAPATSRERDITIVAALERALARLETQRHPADPRAHLELRGRLAATIGRQSRVDQATDALSRAYADALGQLGPTDPITLDLGLDLLQYQSIAGRYSEARGLVAQLDPLIPMTSPARRAKLLGKSSAIAWRERDVARARREGKAALHLARDAQDVELLSGVLSDFGAVMLGIQEVDEAVVAYEEVLALSEQRFGPKHEKVALAASALARAYRRQGDLARAERMVERALDIDRAIYPGDHWITANHLNAYAQILRLQRRFDEMLAAHQEGLRISRATLGPEHAEVHRAAGNVGVSLMLLGRDAEALPYLSEAISRKQPSGEASVSIAHYRAAYGYALGLRDRASGAREIERAIAALEPYAITNAHSLSVAIERRIRLALHYDDPVDAQAWLDTLEAAAARVQSPDDAWWVGRIPLLEGAAELAAGQLDDAAQSLARADALLAARANPDLSVAVEHALLSAVAALRRGDVNAQGAARAARGRLADLPFAPADLERIAAELPP